MDLHVEIQRDGDLQAAVLLLRLAVLVEVRAGHEHGADLVRREALELVVGQLGSVLQLLASAERRGGRVFEKLGAGDSQ